MHLKTRGYVAVLIALAVLIAGERVTRKYGSGATAAPEVTLPGLPSDAQVVATAKGDVTGDGKADRVVLYGVPNLRADGMYDRLWIGVIPIRAGKGILISPPEEANYGYDPSLWLGDLTGDNLSDILMRAATGSSGGTVAFAGYSVRAGRPRFLCDNVRTRVSISGRYLNGYKAVVRVVETGRSYTVDLSDRKADYDRLGIYKDGKLLKPTKPWIDPASLVHPVRSRRRGPYDLKLVQAVAGAYHADGIGDVVSRWRWNGKQESLVSAQYVYPH